jgi:hypothetical protein
MGVERPRGRAAVHRLEDGSLDFDVVGPVQRLANRAQHIGTGQHHFPGFGPDDEIDISLTDPRLLGQGLVRDR